MFASYRFAAAQGKKGKKKGQIAAATSAPPPKKAVKLSHPPESFEIWGKLGFKPPGDVRLTQPQLAL